MHISSNKHYLIISFLIMYELLHKIKLETKATKQWSSFTYNLIRFILNSLVNVMCMYINIYVIWYFEYIFGSYYGLFSLSITYSILLTFKNSVAEKSSIMTSISEMVAIVSADF